MLKIMCEINEKQIDNDALMLDIFHSYMPVVCTFHDMGVSKKIVWYMYSCCFLLIFVAKKATNRTELQLLCTQGSL